MQPILEPYPSQVARWPRSGRALLAQTNAMGVVVYQAFRPAIATYATRHGTLGGDAFSLNRMTWVKPGFLWMMHRSGWASKEGQERVLAITVERAFFERIVMEAQPTVGGREGEGSPPSVLAQWDPDHDPLGAPLERKVIQLGLRGDAVRSYVGGAIRDVEDVTELVHEQRRRLSEGGVAALLTPSEEVYAVETEGNSPGPATGGSRG